MSHAITDSGSKEDDGQLSQTLDRIRDALHGLRFGAVTVIVQDGVAVQVDRVEKLRLVRS